MCIIGDEGASAQQRLIQNLDMIDELCICCNERLILGQADIKQLADHLNSLSESDSRRNFSW